ncbi:hypothetical protein [Mesorhizobium abyssinicae]|uniref:hypothetical protein n=1 Tax=Mesorhizobium abyssinicae TaxID=1209958 RepID=UPI00339B7A2C
MKRSSTIYAVYHPPVFGLPFLAVVLKPDGTITSRQFKTADEARAFNKVMAQADQSRGKTQH